MLRRWVAKHGDEWLSRGMGGKIGSAPVCHSSLSGFESRHPSKIMKYKNDQNTLARPKNIQHKNNYLLTYGSYVPVYNRFHRGEWISRASGGEGALDTPGPLNGTSEASAIRAQTSITFHNFANKKLSRCPYRYRNPP